MNDQADSQPSPPIPANTASLIYNLCMALKSADVNYCHWKSNIALDRSASGDNDLDVLISRRDAKSFTQILLRHGFKEARAQLPPQLPGVLDYYGHDEQTDKFVHVHTHYRLVVGDDRTKNYHLPVEEAFLASATQGDLFRVPAAVFEFIVFVVRMVLKYSTSDTLVGRPRAVPKAERAEFEFLRSRVSQPAVNEVLNRHFGFIGQPLFDACVQSLSRDCPARTRLRTGRVLHRHLRPYARHPGLVDGYLKLWRRVAKGVRRRIPGGLRKRRLANGGLVIALVGGDGAGKSTAVEALRNWLSREFDTRSFHLGRPTWSMTTYLVRAVLKAGGLPGRLARRAAPGTDNGGARPDYSQLLRQFCKARDRFRAYTKMRRFTARGGIAICDRFPLAHVTSMDGPELRRVVEASQYNALCRWLVKHEETWYSLLAPPDILIALQIDPETAVRRKTDENPADVRRRVATMSQANWAECGALLIDAGRPQADVLSELKSVVWVRL